MNTQIMKPTFSAHHLFVKHFRKHGYRLKVPTAFSSKIFPPWILITHLHTAIDFYSLPPSYSCFFAIILSMILVFIRPITISWGKAEKVAFVQTTIVVTLLHLGRKIEFSDYTVSARTKPAPTSLSSLLFLKVIFPLISWTLQSWHRHLPSVCSWGNEETQREWG